MNRMNFKYKNIITVIVLIITIQFGFLFDFTKASSTDIIQTLSPPTRFAQEVILLFAGKSDKSIEAAEIFKTDVAFLYITELIVRLISSNGPNLSENVLKEVINRHTGEFSSDRPIFLDIKKTGNDLTLLCDLQGTGQIFEIRFTAADKKILKPEDIRVTVSVADVRKHENTVSSEFQDELDSLKRSFEYIEEDIAGTKFGWFLSSRDIISADSEYEKDNPQAKELRHALHKYFPLKRKLILHYAARKSIRNVLIGLDSLENVKAANTNLAKEYSRAVERLQKIAIPQSEGLIRRLKPSSKITGIDEIRGNRTELIDILSEIESSIRILKNRTNMMLRSIMVRYFPDPEKDSSETAVKDQMDIFEGIQLDVKGIKRAADKVDKILTADIPGLDPTLRSIYQQRYFNILRAWKDLYGKTDSKFFQDKVLAYVGKKGHPVLQAVDKSLGMYSYSFTWSDLPESLPLTVDIAVIDYTLTDSTLFQRKSGRLLSRFAEKGIVLFSDRSSDKIDFFLKRAASMGITMVKKADNIPSTRGRKAVLFSFRQKNAPMHENGQMELFNTGLYFEDPAAKNLPERFSEGIMPENVMQDLIDSMRAKAIFLREQGRVLFIALDTSWLPDGHQELSGVRSLLKGFERTKQLYGLYNIVIICAHGEDLGRSLESALEKETKRGYGLRMSDIFIIGDADIPAMPSLRRYRPGEEGGAFFAEIFLQGDFSYDTYIGFMDIIRAALALSYGEKGVLPPKREFLEVRGQKGRQRYFVFELIPGSRRFDPADLNDQYRRELEALLRA